MRFWFPKRTGNSGVKSCGQISLISRKLINVCWRLSFWISSSILAQDSGLGFRLAIYDENNPAPSEVIMGHICDEQAYGLPSDLRQRMEQDGHHIFSGQSEAFYLLTFYQYAGSGQPFPAEGIASSEVNLEPYIEMIPWGNERRWLKAFYSHPETKFGTDSPLAGKLPDERLMQMLDTVGSLARWILNQESYEYGVNLELQERAKSILQSAVSSEAGGICSPAAVDRVERYTSTLGFNILSACMLAASALGKSELVSWVLDQQYHELVRDLIIAKTTGKLNVLHLSLLKQPHFLEPLLNSYPDQDSKVRAIREKTSDGFNCLMIAVTEAPELTATVLQHVPVSERPSIFQDTLQDSNITFTPLEQAIYVHPENTGLVKTLLDACPDDETITALITRPVHDGWGAVIMAALKNSETLKLLINRYPGSDLPLLLGTVMSTGGNVLTVAACYPTDAVSTILKASPSNEITASLLTEQDVLGMNALNRSIENSPDNIPLLLDAAPDERTLTRMLTARDNDGFTPLNLAFWHAPAHVDRLIKACPNKSVLAQVLTDINGEGQNALHRAITCRKPELVSRILDASPGNHTTHTLLTAQDNAGNNALILAIWYGYPELVDVLLSACPNAPTLEAQKQTVANGGANALMSAAQFVPEVMASLLEYCRPAQMLKTNNNGDNALIMAAAMSGTYDYSPVLLDTLLDGAPTTETRTKMLTHCNNAGENALLKASLFASPTVVEKLIQASDALGVKDLSQQAAQRVDQDGRHAMMAAAQSNPEVMPLLLGTCRNNQTSIRKMLAARERNHGGWSVLEHAVGFHNTRHVNELLNVAHHLGVLEGESERVQRRALEYSNASALRFMKYRNYSLQPARKMFSGMTAKQRRERDDCRHILPPLDDKHLGDEHGQGAEGIFSQYPEVVKAALDKGENPDQRNSEGDTPLHLAVVKHNSPELVELLLENKADPALATQGYNPLQAACLFSQPSILPLLKYSLDSGLVRGERSFAIKNGLMVPRIHDGRTEDGRAGLLCALCHETFRAEEMPVVLPCFHQMYCTKCLTDSEKYQYEEWHRYNSFQPFRCYLCQQQTRNVVNYETGEIEYIARLRRRQKLGGNWGRFYDANKPDSFHWPMVFDSSRKL